MDHKELVSRMDEIISDFWWLTYLTGHSGLAKSRIEAVIASADEIKHGEYTNFRLDTIEGLYMTCILDMLLVVGEKERAHIYEFVNKLKGFIQELKEDNK